MTTVLDSLNTALHRAFARDERVLLLGQDVLDPYGGAFKVTRGLSTKYPERVLTTPISEAGMVGVASGMALRGMRPIVEIMFGDFLTLAADQLINHAAKFRWMYNDQVRVPLLVRTPMGGRRGYGPTHSQTLEKLFLGVPGLRILSPAALGDPGEMLFQVIIQSEDPVLFIENKLLYLLHLDEDAILRDFTLQSWQSGSEHALQTNSSPLSLIPPAPGYTLAIRGAPGATLTIVAYGYMAELARQACLKLAFEKEVFSELIVPTQLAPFQMDAILDSARRTGNLLVVEEGNLTSGWGAEILARLMENSGSSVRGARRLAARDFPIPVSPPLENAILPGVEDIVLAVQEFLTG